MVGVQQTLSSPSTPYWPPPGRDRWGGGTDPDTRSRPPYIGLRHAGRHTFSFLGASRHREGRRLNNGGGNEDQGDQLPLEHGKLSGCAGITARQPYPPADATPGSSRTASSRSTETRTGRSTLPRRPSLPSIGATSPRSTVRDKRSGTWYDRLRLGADPVAQKLAPDDRASPGQSFRPTLS